MNPYDSIVIDTIERCINTDELSKILTGNLESKPNSLSNISGTLKDSCCPYRRTCEHPPSKICANATYYRGCPDYQRNISPVLDALINEIRRDLSNA